MYSQGLGKIRIMIVFMEAAGIGLDEAKHERPRHVRSTRRRGPRLVRLSLLCCSSPRGSKPQWPRYVLDS